MGSVHTGMLKYHSLYACKVGTFLILMAYFHAAAVDCCVTTFGLHKKSFNIPLYIVYGYSVLLVLFLGLALIMPCLIEHYLCNGKNRYGRRYQFGLRVNLLFTSFFYIKATLITKY